MNNKTQIPAEDDMNQLTRDEIIELRARAIAISSLLAPVMGTVTIRRIH